MFAMILRSTWSWTRQTITGIALLSFIVPAAGWRLAVSQGDTAAVQIMNGFSVAGPTLAIIAVLGSFMLAVIPWQVDGEARHVYPLSLPLPWSRYVAMRFAAGAITLLVPALALYLGCVAALSYVDMPPMLQAYPFTLTLRFLLASTLIYSLSFMLQYVAGRNSTKVLLGAMLAIVALTAALEGIGQGALVESAAEVLFDGAGPFGILTQSWSLIDV